MNILFLRNVLFKLQITRYLLSILPYVVEFQECHVSKEIIWLYKHYKILFKPKKIYLNSNFISFLNVENFENIQLNLINFIYQKFKNSKNNNNKKKNLNLY
jgi:amino acid permease